MSEVVALTPTAMSKVSAPICQVFRTINAAILVIGLRDSPYGL
jgi:hypothetical protein